MVLLVLFLPVAYWLIFRNTDKNKTKVTLEEISKTGIMKPAMLTLLIIIGIGPLLSAQNSYSLQQCKTMALQNNFQVKNKVLEAEVSEQVKKAAFTKYFPQVEATALSFRVNKPLMEMNIPGGNLPVYDGNPANLPLATQFAYFPGTSISMFEKGTIGMVTATQPVFAGRRIALGNKLAGLGVEVSQMQLEVTQDEISFETEQQYWQLFALEEKSKTLERYIQLVDTLHKEVNDAFQAGLITKNDLLKVELKQNELEMNRLKLANGIKLSKMALCQFIGMAYNDEISFADQLPEAVNPQLIFTNHQQALSNRDEYQLLQKSMEAEKYQTRMQLGEYMPQLGVGAGGLYLDVMDDAGPTSGMVFGTVNIPISGWWEASHKMKERQIKEEQNRNMVTDNTGKLLLQMQQAFNTLDESFMQVQMAGISIKQAKENLKVIRDNYEAGMVNVSDMLEAQALVQSSNDNLINNECNYQIAKAKYLQVIGKSDE
jgi:outer membrane protein TolC